MIKKAGLTIAVAAAGMLAISPLAFAGDYNGGGHDGGWGGHGGHSSPGGPQIQNGLVNLQDVADINANACGNNVLSNVLGIMGNQVAAAGADCKITDKGDGHGGPQIQNGLVNAQDVVKANLNACGNNILDNVGAVAGAQGALAGADCKVTSK
ncbi:hypothetical protein [Pseudonocardia sp.]|uniref:hypothetical protein n=1 Tax=Pseudonocardia sp. TaxID=60912 RepID=UPI0026028622|nr:hypothetical protein [Pseudonocardia sp.]MCW2718729.1 hypothetical protein [Pseudonocardia sp.]MDT7616759.1 hypothetical protein [Pseudonocardiales bacterium]